MTASAQFEGKLSVYFRTGADRPDDSMFRKISNFSLNMPHGKNLIINIEGNTDSIGTNEYNLKLSTTRAQSIETLIKKFVTYGLGDNTIEWNVNQFGEERPIADNSTEEGRSQNRRVDISVREQPSSLIKEQPSANQPAWTIKDIYNELRPQAQSFCINNNYDTVITTKAGSIVYVKANSFSVSNDCSCVTITIEEAVTKADIVSNNLSSMLNGKPLVSQGMININAYCKSKGKDKALEFLKDIVVMTPADKILPDAKRLTGEWDANNDMQWKVDTNKLQNFNPSNAKNCLNSMGLRCRTDRTSINCDTCAFFFCRLGRKIKGIGSRKQRTENADLILCIKAQRSMMREAKEQQKRAEQAYKKLDPAKQARIDSISKLWKVNPNKLAGAMDQCGSFLNMLIEKKINDLQGFIDAMQKQMDSLNVPQSYRTKILLNDLQYNVFTVIRPGWNNVDWLMKLDPDNLVDFTVLPVVKKDLTDCKLVFKNQRTVIEGIEENGKYVFKGLPRGEQAWLVFFEARENAEASFGIKEITNGKGEFIIDLRPSTIAAIKERLETMDKK